jgi:hypothetical protein
LSFAREQHARRATAAATDAAVLQVRGVKDEAHQRKRCAAAASNRHSLSHACQCATGRAQRAIAGAARRRQRRS